MADRQYPDTRYGAIQFAYDELSDDDKINIDLQVKRILDHIEMLNFDRRVNGQAIFQMSRAGAMEILYMLGRLVNPKII